MVGGRRLGGKERKGQRKQEGENVEGSDGRNGDIKIKAEKGGRMKEGTGMKKKIKKMEAHESIEQEREF